MKIIMNKSPRICRFFVLYIALCFISAPISVHARELTKHHVRGAVQTWVRYVTAEAKPKAVISKMEPYTIDGKILGYIAHLKHGGYCICGRDDMVLPVYLYSPQGLYDPENPGCQYVLCEIHERTEALRKALEDEPAILQPYGTILASRAAYWKELITGRVPEQISERRLGAEPQKMALKLTSKWHQKSPYNDRCPELTPGDDEHTVVGCVATAMAQIMYYWKWPDSGEGNADYGYSYRWSDKWIKKGWKETEPLIPQDWANRLKWIDANEGELLMKGYWDVSLRDAAAALDPHGEFDDAIEDLYDSLPGSDTRDCFADFGATTYRWDLLDDVHTDPPDAGDAEVATLCYHTGMSVDMYYGVRGSSPREGDSREVPKALEDYFRYDPDAIREKRNTEKMVEEIQWLRPVFLEGHGAPGGHAFVVYGYDMGTGYGTQFLMNMGFKDPNASAVWYTCDDVEFPFRQKYIIRIAPKDVVKFVGSEHSGDGSPANPYKNIEQAIAEAPNEAKLIFKAGSINTFSGDQLVIRRPLKFKGYNATIR